MHCCLTVHCKLQFKFLFCLSNLLGSISHVVFLISDKIQVHTVAYSYLWHTQDLPLSSVCSSTHTSSKQKFNYLLDGYHHVKFCWKGQWKGTHRCRAWVCMSHSHRKSGLKMEDLQGTWATLLLTAIHSFATPEIAEYKKKICIYWSSPWVL